MLNRIVIMGRLTRDPELRRTQSGVAVTTITVAVDRDYQSRDAQEKQTDFIDVVAWRSTAEFVSKYFHKGDMILVGGRMQSRKYTGNDGIERRIWELAVDNTYFGGSKKDSGGGGGQSAADYYASQGQYGAQSAPAAAQPQQQQQFTELDDDDGELPF